MTKRGDIVKFEGVVGRVTFADPITKYLRIQRGNWKTTCYEKDLTPISTEEIASFPPQYHA